MTRQVSKQPNFSISWIGAVCLTFVLTIPIAGCGHLLTQAIKPQAEDVLGKMFAVTLDVTMLLAQLEQKQPPPERISIAFNEQRYPPQDHRETEGNKQALEKPLQRPYQVEIKPLFIQGYPPGMESHVKMPPKTTGSRIPVEVSSFSDPDGQFPMAKVEAVVQAKSHTSTVVHWFDYVEGRWTPVTSPEAPR